MYINSQKADEVWFRGRKIKEAWWRGQKVYSSARLPRQATITGVRAGFFSANWDIAGMTGDKSMFSQLSPSQIKLAVPARLTSVTVLGGVPSTQTVWVYNGKQVTVYTGDIIPAGATAAAPLSTTITLVEVI